LNSYIPAKVRGELRRYWRRRWLILAISWGLSAIGWFAVMVLPDRYEAMTRIYVETDNLLTPLLRNITVQADVNKQLEVLQRTLLNRNNMSVVAHAADLDLDLQSEQDKENLYRSLAKQITVRAEGSNLFLVTYSSANPKLAKKIVESLLNIFVETNLGQNRTNMESARDFIETQIAEYERKLKDADERLADYQAHHIDVLAGAGNTSFSVRLDGARQELNAMKARIDDLMALRQQLAANLASIPQYIEVDTPGQVVITGNGASNSPPTSPRARVSQLEAQLAQLQANDTDQHPDVIATKRALDAAREDLAKQAKDGGSGGPGPGRGRVSNPVYEQIKLRLVQAEGELAQAISHSKLVAAEAQRLQGLAETAPKVEAELADLNREYGVIKGKYEELLSRRESARISEAAENKGDKVQFRIIEPPQVPSQPSFPNRPLMVSAILILSLGAGVAAVFLLQKIDDTVGSPETLSEEFNVRVLGAVPQVENLTGRRRRRIEQRNLGLASGSLVGAYAIVLCMAVFYQSFASILHFDWLSVLMRIRDHVG
jgi:polysaccharide chain length determinant protein (PEP-CTERM system associated)